MFLKISILSLVGSGEYSGSGIKVGSPFPAAVIVGSVIGGLFNQPRTETFTLV
jgi:hypothetical protein